MQLVKPILQYATPLLIINKTMKKILCSFIVLFVTFFAYSQQMTIQVDGNVTFDNSLYTIMEAGNDFPASIENESALYVSITKFSGGNYNANQKWKINILKSDLIWNPNLILEVIRTGDGRRPDNPGNTIISDGTSYQTITNTSNYFFSGKSEIVNIPINFKLSGVSITMGAKNFETNIYLTVYDD